jgi:Uma2 family endonuclease
MSTVQTKALTAEEFWEWCRRPENFGKRVELEHGEIVEMPPPGEIHGSVCWWIGVLLGLFVLRRGRGRATSNDTGFVVEEGPDTVRGPDILFFDESRPLDSLNWKHTRQVPTLVIEVVSPNDKPNKINKRIGEYLRRGVSLVWIVDPDDKTVGVHRKGEFTQTHDEGDELIGYDILPDLKFKVAELFTLPGTAPTP